MVQDSSIAPIGDDEFLFRRIPASVDWFDPNESRVADDAFRPRRHDMDGISLVRSRYCTVEEAARAGARPGKRYYVACLCVADLRKEGFQIKADPLPDNPGHVILPELRYEIRRTREARERVRKLCRLVRRVEGPFGI